jgi:hypothetical protein
MKTELLRGKTGFLGDEKETQGVGREIFLNYNHLKIEYLAHDMSPRPTPMSDLGNPTLR